MTNRSEDILWQAAEWAAKTEGEKLTPQQQAQLNAWLATDERHLGAYWRARALLCAAAEAAQSGAASSKSEQSDAGNVRHFRLSRRQIAISGLLAASIAGAIVFTAIANRPAVPIALTTGIGQVKVATLPDGSTVTLNTGSAATVEFSGHSRIVVLSHGQALFDVAKDRSRPFVVHAEGMQVRAVGTSFIVSNISGRPLEATVREGAVQVTVASQQNTPAIPLVAGTRLRASKDGELKIDKLSQQDVEQDLSWREGYIFLRQRSLAYAAEEFARYSSRSIVIEDPAVARLTVSGLYEAKNPGGFASAVARLYHLDMTATANTIHLSRKN